MAPLSTGYSELLPPHIHSDDFSRGCRRVSPLHASLRAIPSQRGLVEADGRWHGFPAAGPGGCNVVISDKRLPGDTHCAPLAASTLRLPSARSACRTMFTHTHVTNAASARHVPLVTVHYVANRDISLGHHPSTSRLRVSSPNLSAIHNRHS